MPGPTRSGCVSPESVTLRSGLVTSVLADPVRGRLYPLCCVCWAEAGAVGTPGRCLYPGVCQVFVSLLFWSGGLPALGHGDPFKRRGKHLTLLYACKDVFSWLTLACEGRCLFPS